MNSEERMKLIKISEDILPNTDYLAVVRTVKSTTTAGGLHLPESSSKKREKTGIILAVGDGVPDIFSIGTKIFFSIDALDEIEIDGANVVFMHKDKVFGKLK